MSEERTPRRWSRVVLGLSLALNLFVVGIAGGAAWRWHNGSGPPPLQGGPVMGIPSVIRELPEERRHVAMALFKERRGIMREKRMETREARKRATALLRQDPFDPAAFSAALSDIGVRSDAARQETHRLIVDLAQSFTVEERRALAAAFEERLNRRRPPPGRRGPPGEHRPPPPPE